MEELRPISNDEWIAFLEILKPWLKWGAGLLFVSLGGAMVALRNELDERSARLFNMFAISGMVIIVVVSAMYYMKEKDKERQFKQAVMSVKNLAFARAHHKTVLSKRGPAPGPKSVGKVSGAKEVYYKSGDLELKAWIMNPNKKRFRGKRPGILYCHSGFAPVHNDFEVARYFADIGCIVMVPTWRGEVGNKGDYEMCYGEVDDAISALEFLARQPDVATSRLYAVGDKLGGTIVMLLAESTNMVAKVAAFAGSCDMKPPQKGYKHFQEYSQRPFEDGVADISGLTERHYRSFHTFLHCLQCPIYLGCDDPEDKELFKIVCEDTDPNGPLIKWNSYTYSDHQKCVRRWLPRVAKFFGVL